VPARRPRRRAGLPQLACLACLACPACPRVSASERAAAQSSFRHSPAAPGRPERITGHYAAHIC
jgi:hypothetical protein